MSNGRFVAAISRAEGWTFGLFELFHSLGFESSHNPQKIIIKMDANEKLYLRQLGKPFNLKIRIMLR